MTEALSHDPNSSTSANNPALIRWAGMIGVAASCLGVASFVLGCAGFDRGFALYWVPMIAGGLGLLMTIVGGILRHGGVEDTPIVAALFVNLFAVVGGLLECALWRGWDIFYRAVSL